MFDLIYCCSTYGLFDGIKFVEPKSAERKLMQERKEKAQELADALEKAKQKLAELDEAKAYAAGVFQPGAEVRHKAFGTGTVSEVNDSTFTAHFSSAGIKSLNILTCIVNALVTVEDREIQEKLNGYRDILRRDQQICDAVSWAEKALLPYSEYLE